MKQNRFLNACYNQFLSLQLMGKQKVNRLSDQVVFDCELWLAIILFLIMWRGVVYRKKNFRSKSSFCSHSESLLSIPRTTKSATIAWKPFVCNAQTMRISAKRVIEKSVNSDQEIALVPPVKVKSLLKIPRVAIEFRDDRKGIWNAQTNCGMWNRTKWRLNL